VSKNIYGYINPEMNLVLRKLRYFKYLMVLMVAITLASIAFAAFSDQSKVTGGHFKVSSADIKLLQNLAAGPSSDNLKDEINGPSFENISEFWSIDYGVELYNNGSRPMLLTSNANYTTANDPSDLRSEIYVEIFDWNDADNDVSIDEGELGNSYGKKTIIKWKTEGYDLVNIDVGELKSFILRFSTEEISDAKQGKSALFDFEFDAIQQ
jgi:hypothetical protein